MKNLSLWLTIRALDAGEARNCKARIQHESQILASNYGLVFNTLYQMKKYNHEAFLKTTSKHIAINKLSLTKTRLKALILETVADLHDERRFKNDPCKLIRDARVYVELGLYEHAKSDLLKAIETANAQDELLTELRLRELLREVYKRTEKESPSKEITNNEYQLVTVSQKLAQLLRYEVLRDQMLALMKNGREKTGASHLGIHELIQSKEMQSVINADSKSAQLMFYTISCMYHKNVGQLKTAITHQRKLLSLWEELPVKKKLHPHQYNRALANLIGLLSSNHKTDEVPFYLEKMKTVEVSGRRAEIQKFCDVELQHQFYDLNTGQLKKMLDREQQVIDGLSNYGRHLPQDFRISLWANLGFAHLLTDNLAKAKSYFNKIKGLGQVTERPDLQGLAQILHLLFVSDDDNLENEIQNTARFLNKRKEIYAMELTVVKWMRKHKRTLNIGQRTASFNALAELMLPYRSAKAKGADEITVWAIAKTTDKTINSLYLEATKKEVVLIE